jgi:hypothetical protein
LNYYTPGPWHLVLRDNRIEISAETRDEIARIDLDDTDEDALAETETNARLICAAPLLLAACEALVTTCQERFEGLEIVALVPGDLRRAVDLGTAALAGAKRAS